MKLTLGYFKLNAASTAGSILSTNSAWLARKASISASVASAGGAERGFLGDFKDFARGIFVAQPEDGKPLVGVLLEPCLPGTRSIVTEKLRNQQRIQHYHLLPLGPLPCLVKVAPQFVLGCLPVWDSRDVGDHVAHEELGETLGINPVPLAKNNDQTLVAVPAHLKLR